jgi:branched-subunit amino acid aminotransferase/4-amino-4-deoxychorismate lyase
VAEGARWALLWWEGDRVAGPPLALGVLPSVARARISELTGEEVLERRVGRAGLETRNPFLANAARGIAAVEELDGQTVRPHRALEALRTRFWG